MPITVGVIGGGQLARMMVPPAVALGIDLRVFAEIDGSSAAIAAEQVGDYTNIDEVLQFARGVDVITFDHEHVPQNVLAALLAEGIAVHPAPAALAVAQNKLVMRTRLAELGLPVPDWAQVDDADALTAFIDAHGGVAVVKTPTGGYDGKGVRVLAQLVARRPSGEVGLWPVVETVQRNGVCAEVIAPAPGAAGIVADVAADIAVKVAEGIGVTGVLAVELFETTDDRLLINELAMRPHNSGHWTIDGARTSQFEQHLRAVLDLPLGATGSHREWSVMVNVLGGPLGAEMPDRYAAALADQPTVKVHSYGKASRPGRKVGHVTAVGDELDEVVYQARAGAAFFD
jgi:5-(carboxyamino)imidazole ribonucleotide synthase